MTLIKTYIATPKNDKPTIQHSSSKYPKRIIEDETWRKIMYKAVKENNENWEDILCIQLTIFDHKDHTPDWIDKGATFESDIRHIAFWTHNHIYFSRNFEQVTWIDSIPRTPPKLTL